MIGLFEAAWVIARRDFVASVFSRAFILFLMAPVLVLGFALFVGRMADRVEAGQNQPVVALVTDSATTASLNQARERLVGGTTPQSFPLFRTVAPAEHIQVQARNLLADEASGYSAVLSGTIDHPLLTGPARIDDLVAHRIQLVVDEARRDAALGAAHIQVAGGEVTRDVTAQAAGNLQMVRRTIARTGQSIIFGVTIMLATLLLSTMVEEKSNKVIEVLAAAVPLDAVFLGKLLAMLGISLVGLAVWGGALATLWGLGEAAEWITLPNVGPAIGWPIWILLLIVYYTANFLLLGSLFLGIGAQASNIREIQTISMPVTLLQLMVLLLAMNVIGGELTPLAMTAFAVPFSSPLSMIAFASQSDMLWPHFVALAWQALWVVLIIRLSARLFRTTVLKSGQAGGFFSFLGRRAKT